MTQQTPPSRAGGCLIAAAILLGAGVGVVLRQPSIGILAGTGAGIALALLLWLRGRHR